MNRLNEIYPKLKSRDINFNNLDGWAISVECYEWILDNIPEGDTIIEFGSGPGTIELSRFHNVHTVEHQQRFTTLAPRATYILAEIVDGWYDSDVVFNNLPDTYSLIIVDGPPNIDQQKTRNNISKYWDRFDTSVPIIMDDTHREDEYNFAIETAELLGKTWTQYEGWQKNFIVLT
jgi:hypothetical protein